MTPEQNEYYELAMKYRTGLESLYWLINHNTRCECEFKPDWMDLIDSGTAHNSADLREHGYICMFCKNEYIYAEAIGEELFVEQATIRIQQFLDEKFQDPIAVIYEREDGHRDYTIVEREDLERFGKFIDEPEEDE